MAGRDDLTVSQAARNTDRFLITQDLDFSDIRRYTPGTHPGVLLVRLRLPGRTALFDRILSRFIEEDVSVWSGCLVVASDRKLRVRRPGS